MSSVKEVTGDLFDAPEGSVLIHGCNCQGAWGSGIALAFRQKYPEAYRIFRAHCRSYLSTPQVKPTNTDDATQSRTLKLPEGTTLVIPPQEKDYTSSGRKKHWIVCLFTSWHYGQRRSSPDVILENTVLAVEDFKRQLGQFKESAEGEDKGSERPGELWGCRFNAGLFGVPWEKTKGVLEEAGLEMTIVRPKEN